MKKVFLLLLFIYGWQVIAYSDTVLTFNGFSKDGSFAYINEKSHIAMEDSPLSGTAVTYSLNYIIDMISGDKRGVYQNGITITEYGSVKSKKITNPSLQRSIAPEYFCAGPQAYFLNIKKVYGLYPSNKKNNYNYTISFEAGPDVIINSEKDETIISATTQGNHTISIVRVSQAKKSEIVNTLSINNVKTKCHNFRNDYDTNSDCLKCRIYYGPASSFLLWKKETSSVYCPDHQRSGKTEISTGWITIAPY